MGWVYCGMGMRCIAAGHGLGVLWHGNEVHVLQLWGVLWHGNEAEYST